LFLTINTLLRRALSGPVFSDITMKYDNEKKIEKMIAGIIKTKNPPNTKNEVTIPRIRRGIIYLALLFRTEKTLILDFASKRIII